jgi:hypothetical protein
MWSRVRRMTLWRNGTLFEAAYELINGEWKRWGGGMAFSKYDNIRVGVTDAELADDEHRWWQVRIAEIHRRNRRDAADAT